MTTDKRKHIIKIIALIAILLSFCNGLLVAYSWQYEGGKMINLVYLFFSSFVWMFIYGFAFGALTSFIPFKELKYKQKYLPNALICTIVITIPFIIHAIKIIYYTKYFLKF